MFSMMPAKSVSINNILGGGIGIISFIIRERDSSITTRIDLAAEYQMLITIGPKGKKLSGSWIKELWGQGWNGGSGMVQGPRLLLSFLFTRTNRLDSLLVCVPPGHKRPLYLYQQACVPNRKGVKEACQSSVFLPTKPKAFLNASSHRPPWRLSATPVPYGCPHLLGCWEKGAANRGWFSTNTDDP